MLDQLQDTDSNISDLMEDDSAIDNAITLQKKEILKKEQILWASKPSTKALSNYQESFAHLEKLYTLKTSDDRYNFKIVIPVADRPQHLKQCLDSLLALCKYYGYGGIDNNTYNKVSVLIADDSKDNSNIALNKQYCRDLTQAGVITEYFDLESQYALVKEFTNNNTALKNIIPYTDHISSEALYAHKGASNMRNICYLKLKDEIKDNTLIYFIDSDQEFRITAEHSDGSPFAINYFHYLNENFKSENISILTGKVVGDPPVSPAVMAGNFQQDVKHFLETIAKLKPEDNCQFHQDTMHCKDTAAYHDMANLFGFNHNDSTFSYHCALSDQHSNLDCFNDFAEKLSHFFYGEHPTRKTFFNYDDGFTALTPARTVYTGNYVIKAEALDYFIPFAPLKLRMAGPVLGRILQANLGDKFVSANLPMLHNRTVDATGQSEFRAGVEKTDVTINLGSEFIRQFYGDVMLFSMVEISKHDYPKSTIDEQVLTEILNVTYEKIRDSYIDRHNTILKLKSALEISITKETSWWNNNAYNISSLSSSKQCFHDFLKNIQINFDDDTHAYIQITSNDHAKKYLANILQAILEYQKDMASWKKVIS